MDIGIIIGLFKQELIPGVYGLFRWSANKTNRSRFFGFEIRKNDQEVGTTVSPTASAPDKYRDIKGIYLKDGSHVTGQVLAIENSRMIIKTEAGVKSYSIINDIDRFDRN